MWIITKKNKHDVSNAINILDPSQTIDGKICKARSNSSWDGSNIADNGDVGARKCAGGTGHNSKLGLKNMVDLSDSTAITAKFTEDTKMGNLPKTSEVISKDISGLNREQHGVVSSAFAKAHEGAEIVEIRSISTTSVMVNA